MTCNFQAPAKTQGTAVRLDINQAFLKPTTQYIPFMLHVVTQPDELTCDMLAVTACQLPVQANGTRQFGAAALGGVTDPWLGGPAERLACGAAD